MLEITIPAQESYDSVNNRFHETEARVVQLEHSLFALSEWESKWEKPFLNNKDVTREELVDYVRCMSLDREVEPSAFQALSNDNINEVNDYIKRKMTATWFSEKKGVYGRPQQSEIITAELIYFWMVSYQIPFECQYWHLNRLITLIQVCSEKNKTPQKKNRRDMMNSRTAMNRARLAQSGSSG